MNKDLSRVMGFINIAPLSKQMPFPTTSILPRSNEYESILHDSWLKFAAWEFVYNIKCLSNYIFQWDGSDSTCNSLQKCPASS